jgi:hypothetical protein
MTDYANNTNVVLRKTVNANDILTLPGTTLVTGRTYYMDWHTDDFYYNNWFNDVFPQPEAMVAFKTDATHSSFYFSTSLKGNSRKTFLANDDVSSSWHAVDAYMGSNNVYTSFWGSLTEFDRYRQVTVYKDFRALYTYKDAAGNLLSDTLQFKVHNTEDGYIEFMDANGKTLGSMAAGFIAGSKNSSRDSVWVTLPNSDYYFLMTRD